MECAHRVQKVHSSLFDGVVQKLKCLLLCVINTKRHGAKTYLQQQRISHVLQCLSTKDECACNKVSLIRKLALGVPVGVYITARKYEPCCNGTRYPAYKCYNKHLQASAVDVQMACKSIEENTVLVINLNIPKGKYMHLCDLEVRRP